MSAIERLSHRCTTHYRRTATLRPRCGSVTSRSWSFIRDTFFAQTGARRRSEGSDGPPERPVAVLNDGPRVVVRRPCTMRRWISRLIAESEPLRLTVALIRL